MGLFDLPAPLLDGSHRLWVVVLGDGTWSGCLFLVILAVVVSVVSQEIYRLASPQARIVALQEQTIAAQRALDAHRGEFAEAWPLMGQMLRCAGLRVALVLPGTLLAAYPVIAAIFWLEANFSYRLPPSGTVPVIEAPAPYKAVWIDGNDRRAPTVALFDGTGARVAGLVLSRPVAELHKRQWWNTLAADPAYLPADVTIDSLHIDLAPRQLIAVGPPWLRGWPTVFFPALLVFALIYRAWRGIR